MDTRDYLKNLRKRAGKSHVSRRFQLIGLEISGLLDDEQHKALYIKLAKEHDPDALLRLAKTVGEKAHITHKGAYFMKILKNQAEEEKARLGIATPKKPKTKKQSA